MFKARKNRTEGDMIFVDFYSDTETKTESCIPQNIEGFIHWVKSRIEVFNSKEVIDTTFPDGEDIDTAEATQEAPSLTQEEIDRNEWLEKYRKWVRIKTSVVDTGILPISNPKLSILLDDLKSTIKEEYIDFI